MARFYSNENFPFGGVEALRVLGHDVLTSLDAGRANQRIPDGVVLDYARAQGRAVLTLNRRDFVRLHLQNPDHAGVVVCTQDADPVGQAARIHEAVCGLGTLAGRLLRITRPG